MPKGTGGHEDARDFVPFDDSPRVWAVEAPRERSFLVRGLVSAPYSPRVLTLDAAFVRSLRAGDAAAFERLVRAFLPRVRRLALQCLGSPFDQEDAVQEAFTHIDSRLSAIDPLRPESIPGWVVTTARNRILDLARQRRPEVSIVSHVRGTIDAVATGKALSPEDDAALRKHLRECDACRGHYDRTVGVLRLARGGAEAWAPGEAQRITARAVAIAGNPPARPFPR